MLCAISISYHHSFLYSTLSHLLQVESCVNFALYLSPYSLSYMAIHTIEIPLYMLISGSAFVLILLTDVVQNLEVYWVSSKY